jgi:hypothetical protein
MNIAEPKQYRTLRKGSFLVAAESPHGASGAR